MAATVEQSHSARGHFERIPIEVFHMILEYLPGVSPRLEIQIRLFCRNVLLDHWQSSRDTLFWLTRILKPWPMVNQARLIYIIYGPLTLDGRIGWQKLTERAAEESNVKDMADAIRLLHGDQETKEWTADSVISLIDELSGDRNEDTDTFQSLCNVLNANAHFHTEILYTFIKKE
ncbi:UNVERIFIED_CONTAM: hypothetical protein FKN15_038416 [Acipenser sinensis]